MSKKPLFGPISWPRVGVLLLALVAFAAIFGLRLAVDDPTEPILFLLIAPIGLLATEFGLPGGLAGALVASLLVGLWDVAANPAISAFGIGIRLAVFVSAALAVGSLASARRELDAQHSRWFDEVSDLNCVADLGGNFVSVNKAFEKILGYTTKDLLSTPYVAFVHPEDRHSTNTLAAELAGGRKEVVNFENRYRAADGSYHWLRWSATLDSDRGLIYASARDVTEHKKLEEQLRELARTDSLTGLFNRRHFEEEAQRQLDFVRRYGHRAALLLFDIDGFKSLNDAHGHHAGDEALKKLASAINERVRKTDIVARIGGDEFAILLPGVTSADTEIVADVLLSSIRKETKGIAPDGTGITSSLGIALFSPNHDTELKTLLDAADGAMYSAKRAGGDQYKIADVLDLGEQSGVGAERAGRTST